MQTIATHNIEDALRRYAREHDPDAFEQLVHRYQAMVYSACRRQLDVEADIEDAVQETFLTLARKADTIRTNLSAWLYATAIYTASHFRRRSAARSKLVHEIAQQQAINASESEASTWEELGPEIDRALARQSDDDRQLLTERYLLGRSATQLAAERDVSRVTLHKRLNSAVERLRKTLAKRGVCVPAAALLVTLNSVPAEAAPPASLTASLMKIGLAGLGGSGGTSTSMAIGTTVTAAGAGVLSTKALLTTVAVVLLSGTSVVALLAADKNDATAGAAGSETDAGKPASQLPDPAFAGKWITMNQGPNGDQIVLSFNGDQITISNINRDGKVAEQWPWGKLTAGDPLADPPRMQLETLPRADGTQNFGRAIYRIKDDILHLCISGNRDATKTAYPQTFAATDETYHEILYKYSQPIKLPEGQVRTKCSFAPALTGDWADTNEEYLSCAADGSTLSIKNLFTGAVQSEMRILSWDTNAIPRRIEGIYLQHDEKRLIGRRVKMIYRHRNGRLEIAHYNLDKEVSEKWPRNFMPSADLVLKIWEPARVSADESTQP